MDRGGVEDADAVVATVLAAYIAGSALETTEAMLSAGVAEYGDADARGDRCDTAW